MKYMLFNGIKTSQDTVIRDENGKGMVFSSHKEAQVYANQLGLNPYTITDTIEANPEED